MIDLLKSVIYCFKDDDGDLERVRRDDGAQVGVSVDLNDSIDKLGKVGEQAVGEALKVYQKGKALFHTASKLIAKTSQKLGSWWSKIKKGFKVNAEVLGTNGTSSIGVSVGGQK